MPKFPRLSSARKLVGPTVRRLLLAVVFLVGLALGAVMHLDLPVTRRATGSLLGSFLNDTFRGQVLIAELSRLDAFGVTAVGIEVLDPDGRRVLGIRELDVSFDVFAVAHRAARLYEKLSIEVDRVQVRGVELFLFSSTQRDKDGELLTHPSIADAFALRTVSTSTAEGGRPLRIWFRDFRLQNVFASTQMVTLPVLQANAHEAKGTLLITDKGVALDVSRFGLVASGIAGADTAATGSVHLRAPGALWGELDGKVGAVPVTEKFRFEKGRLELEGALPELEPSAVRALWADWPLDRTISLEHTISGVPPRLSLTAVVHTERGDASARGIVTVSPEFEADLDVDTDHLDLSAVRSDFPATDLSARSAVDIWQGAGRPHLELNATLLPSQALGTKIPAIDFVGTYDERGVLLTATLHERGLPVHLDLRRPESGELSFDLELRRTKLEESPRLLSLLGVRGTLAGKIHGKLQGDHIETTSDFQGSSLGMGGTTIAALNVWGSANLPLAAPAQTNLGLNAKATGVSVGDLELDTAEAHVTGPFTRPQVSVDAQAKDGTQLHATATTRTDRFEIDNAKFEVTGRGTPILARVEHLSLLEGRLLVQKFHLESEGRLDADLDMTAQGGDVHMVGENLNVKRLAEGLGLSTGTLAGRLSVQVDASLGHSSQGSAHLALKDGQLLGFTDVSADLKTELFGRETRGSLSFAVEELGRAEGSWDAKLGGHPFSRRSYVDATGRGDLRVLGLDLARASRVASSKLGFEVDSGSLTGSVSFERKQAETLPRVEMAATTEGLAVDIGEKNPIRIDGVDLNWGSSLEPEENRMQLAVRATDFSGDIVAVGGSLDLPLDRWGREFPDANEIRETLLGAPLELVVSIPKRRLDDFPGAQSLPAVSGTVSGRGTILGNLNDPAMQLSLSVEGVNGPSTGLASPLDLATNVRYRKTTGRLVGDLRAREGVSQIGAATFDLVVPFEHLATTPKDAPAWTGRMQMVVDGAPLEVVDVLAKLDLTGQLQGSLTIERTALMPEFDADLRVRHLAIGGRKLGEGSISAQSSDARLLAKTQFDDEYGKLTASAEIGVVAEPWFVRLDEGKPVYVTLRSEKYDAAVLAPFLTEQLSEFSGALNGTLRVEIRPPETVGGPHGTRFSGQMRLSEGTVTPASMGLRLDDTSFDINAAPEGQLNVVRFSNLKARARSDTHNLTGNAKLYFQDLDLVRGRFDLATTTVPVLSSGLKLADVSGRASGTLETQGDETRVVVDVPLLSVELPATSDRELIELGDNPTIEILQPLTEIQAISRETSEKARLWTVDVRLGQDVRIKNRIINLQLRGNPIVHYGKDLNVEGQVELVPGGRIQVLGRNFVIDHGSVAFDTQEVGNPHLDVTATWRAPNGVLVRATVGGTAKKPALAWSSDPPLAGGEAAVIAMVLGGSGGSQSGDASGAGLAYGAAIVNEFVGQSGLQGIEVYATRQTDSGGKGQTARLSDKTWDNYTAAYQVSDKLWFEGSYKQEATGPGTATARSGFSGTLDWRFHPAWSARTELGTLGVGADLLWQYRY